MRQNGTVVLVVEDNDDDVTLIRRAFEKTSLHKQVEVAHDGVGALRYLSGVPPFDDRDSYPLPRLIILDLKMPRMDGFEVLEAVKGNPQTRQIPVVVLTSSSEAADVSRSYHLGANSYLVKPVAFERLADVVAEVERYWLSLNVGPAVGVEVGADN